jgi:branched-chain amino acid transport system ATP-binding protein
VTARLDVEDVSVVFGGVRALDGASMTVEPGQLCGLIGPNGSGKSTMLGALSRLTDLTSGELKLDGTPFSTVEPHRASQLGIARTFQTVRLLPGMTVLANVMFGAGTEAVQRAPVLNWLNLRAAARDESRARAAAEAALERVGMHGHRHEYPLDLPYGMQRRVEIARALAADPQVLLLDEPTAGLTHNERAVVGTVLRRLVAGGMTVVLIEHDLDFVNEVADRVVVLHEGRIIEDGTPDEVGRSAVVREAYLGTVP